MHRLARVSLALVLIVVSARESSGETLAPLNIPPGQFTGFEAPFTPQLREFASSGKRPCASTGALAAVAVPKDFSPDRPWPVLLVSTTSNPGHNSSRRLMRAFTPPALAAGWIVVAADPNSDRDEDTDRLRYALLIAAIARLQLEWPHFPDWPRAFGGFSGGAKRSASLAAMATLLGHRPIGVFQGGCNEPTMSNLLRQLPRERTAFLGIPIFLSGGRSDPIATPELVDEVASALRSAGFTHFRYERYVGGHELFPDHVGEALHWFAALAAPAVPR
jgi:predicted esterase